MVGKIIIFMCGKSIVVFHCSARLLQDFCGFPLFSSLVARLLQSAVAGSILAIFLLESGHARWPVLLHLISSLLFYIVVSNCVTSEA